MGRLVLLLDVEVRKKMHVNVSQSSKAGEHHFAVFN